jgi:Protein of unknown function (DUF2852)
MPLVALAMLSPPAWILLMIFGFWLWWPLGLVTLALIIGSARMGCWSHQGMGCWSHHGTDRWENKMARMQDKMDRFRARMDGLRSGDWRGGPPSSGNRAFDEYRSETLKRLEEEQREFRDFLERLRFAKDKTEFDQFMTERRNRQPDSSPQPQS